MSGVISYHKITDPYIFEENCNQNLYIEILNNFIVAELEK